MSKLANAIFEAIKDATFVWTTGVGKSAAVADLLARYLRNVGVPSAALDAADYWHGGRGGVKESHLLIAVSSGGQTEEVVRIVEDVPCYIVHVGKDAMPQTNMHWLIHGYQQARTVSLDPIQSARAVYDLVCEYAQYAGVSREEAEANHPAGATHGSV